MASVERIEQELAKTEKQLEKAEAALKEFKKDENEGKWLAELKGKLRRKEGFDESEKRAWGELTAKEKRLEQDVRDRLEHVEELQKALLPTTAQPGNDFVTRALGT